MPSRKEVAYALVDEAINRPEHLASRAVAEVVRPTDQFSVDPSYNQLGVQERKKDIQDVVVEEGDALFDINPLGVQRQFEFRTKNIQGGVKVTVFMVSYVNEGTTVSVHKGTVWVSEPGRDKGKVKVLEEGDAIRLEAVDDFNDVLVFDLHSDIEDCKVEDGGRQGQERQGR